MFSGHQVSVLRTAGSISNIPSRNGASEKKRRAASVVRVFALAPILHPLWFPVMALAHEAVPRARF